MLHLENESNIEIIYYDDFYANNITTSTTENSTTTTNYDDENDDIITISFVTAGVIVAVLAAFILIFIYVRSQRRKIQGAYNPASLENKQMTTRAYVIPLPEPERLI